MRHLLSSLLGVEHDLGVVPSVNANGGHPLSILEVGPLQQELLVGQSVVSVVDNDLPIQGVQVFIRWLKLKLTFDLQEAFGINSVFWEV